MAPLFGQKRSDDFGTLFREACARVGVTFQGMNEMEAKILREGSPTTVYLANIKPRVLNAPARDRPAMLDFFLRASLSAPSDAGHTFEEVRSRLMPRIGQPFASAQMKEVPPSKVLLPGRPEETKTAQDPAKGTVVLPAVPTLEVNVVVDEPQTVWYVRDKHLHEWNVTLEALMSLAVENLRRNTSPSQLRPIGQIPGVLACATGDSYDAARLLVLKDLVVPWPREGVLAAAPTRDLLLCVRLDSMEAVRAMNPMLGFAQHLAGREGYAITGHGLWFDGTSWEYFPTRVRDKAIEAFPPPRFVEALNRLAKPSA